MEYILGIGGGLCDCGFVLNSGKLVYFLSVLFLEEVFWRLTMLDNL